MMNPELKAKWIADLKTHEQIHGALRGLKSHGGGTGYCCLGVACLTLGGVFEEDDESVSPEVVPRLNGRALNDGEGLNRYGLELLGINEGTQSTLISLNDSSDSFEPVIGWIEANL